MGEAVAVTIVPGPWTAFAPRGPRLLSAMRDRHEEGLKARIMAYWHETTA